MLRQTAGVYRYRPPELAGFYRIPQRLLEINPKAYIPRYVSLGPFHCAGSGFNGPNDVNILAMEGTKHKYMLCLFDSTLDSKWLLSSCKDYVQNNLEKICNCYNEKPDATSEQVGRNVLVDVCFLLEFLHRMLIPPVRVSDSSMFLSMRRDVALLENQLPLFVINMLNIITQDHLHGRTSVYYNDSDMLKESVFYFSGMLNLVRLTPEQLTWVYIEDNIEGCSHLLDLVTRCHLSMVDSTLESVPTTMDKAPSTIQLRSATQLNVAGVRIEMAGGTKLLALEFANGVLKIPALVIHDSTATLLINLLAYEYLNSETDSSKDYLASYIMLMMHLVQTKEDLELLEKKGILVNELGCREDGSKIFYEISKHVILGSFRFEKLCQQTEAFANSRRRKYMIDFRRLYFRNPWTAVSLFAGVLLLVLTTLQTVYTILSFYQKPR